MSGSGEDAEAAVARAERAFERGDYSTARRLLAGVGDRDGEIASRVGKLEAGMAPDRAVLVLAILSALAFAVLFAVYVVG